MDQHVFSVQKEAAKADAHLQKQQEDIRDCMVLNGIPFESLIFKLIIQKRSLFSFLTSQAREKDDMRTFVKTQLVRIQTRKFSLLSSFRASLDDANATTASPSAFPKKLENYPSESQRLTQFRSMPGFSRPAEVQLAQPSLNVAVAQPTSNEYVEFQHPTEPIRLPFAARLGERPSSAFQRNSAKIQIHVPSMKKGSQAEAAQVNPPASARYRKLTTFSGAPRPQTAPENTNSKKGFGALQSKRKLPAAMPQVSSPPSHTSAAAWRSQGATFFRGQQLVNEKQSARESEESALKGAELEVLLMKQLQLVSPLFNNNDSL